MVDKHPRSANGNAEGSGQTNSITSEGERQTERQGETGRQRLTFEARLAEPLFGLVGHAVQQSSNRDMNP